MNKDIFIKWMKEKHIWNEYKENYKKVNFNTEINNFIGLLTVDAYILSAFNWKTSEEGWDFWNDIDTKWQEYLGANDE